MAIPSFSRSTAGAAPKPPGPPVPAPKVATGLAALLAKPLALAADRETLLKDGLANGLKFFEGFNESRLKLAFGSFDAPMKQALYEVLFLLHVNDPKFKKHKFQGVKLEHVGGALREIPFEAEADLYVEGAPHGVEGIDRLSPIFRPS